MRRLTYSPETHHLAGRQFSMRANNVEKSFAEAPLIVALHGGGYSSAYFDVPGLSLLAHAAAIGIPAVAIDRPGYGETESKPTDHSHAANAAILAEAIGALWDERGGELPGIVLIGHSIGGAIAMMIAASRPAWPLLGVAASGVTRTPFQLACAATAVARTVPPSM